MNILTIRYVCSSDPILQLISFLEESDALLLAISTALTVARLSTGLFFRCSSAFCHVSCHVLQVL
jgi:hypothetical protein